MEMMLLRLALELSRLIADEVVVVGVGWVWLGVRDEVSSRNRDD
jgi:hypothetical protein